MENCKTALKFSEYIIQRGEVFLPDLGRSYLEIRFPPFNKFK